MRITKNNINRAIMEKLGKPIEIDIDQTNNIVFFYSDDPVTGLELAKCYNTSVCTNILSSRTVDEWVKTIEEMLEGGEVY